MRGMLSNLGIAYWTCEWLIRIVMLVVAPVRRPPYAARSWLLLIFFLPIPGLLLYAAIGRPRFPRWRAARFLHLEPFFSDIASRLIAAEARSGRVTQEGASALVRKLGSMPAVGGNSVEFLDDYESVIDRLVMDIDSARHHVRLLVYIFADDATGRRVIDALGRAVIRGVACHTLIDSVGSHHWARGTTALLRNAGVEVRESLPFHWLRGRTRRDMRNHRKLFLIDGTIGYAGSQNIVAKDFRPGVSNRELMARVTGPVVAEMTAIFLADWYLETETMLSQSVDIPPSNGGTVTAQLLPSGADYPLEGFETLLVWQIHRARQRVVIITPYFIPDEDLLGAMRTAVLRGVEVDLVVSAIEDQKLVSLAQRSYYEDLLETGIRIHRFRKYLLHAKNVSIDGELAIIGSSNVDIRSFQLNEEVSLVLLDPPAVATLEGIQRACLAESDRIDLEEWRHRSTRQKIGENMARLVSPLL